MEDAIVHPRVHEKHPELTDAEVLEAWASCIVAAPRLDRDPREYLAIGADGRRRLVEMVARRTDSGVFVIFHAFTPPTRKAMVELERSNRR